MAKFSPSEAAFSGFRFARERPGAVAAWAGLSLLFQIFSFGLLLAATGGSLQVLDTLQQAGRVDPAITRAAFRTLGPTYLILLPLMLIYIGVIGAAVPRSLLSPERLRWGGLRLGAAEFRVLGTLFLLLVVVLCAYALPLIGVIAVIHLASLLHKGPLALLTGALGGFLVLAISICIVVRFSLAIVVTVAEGKIGLGRSWSLTRRHVWSLIGAYLLTTVLNLILVLVFFALTFALAMVVEPGVSLENAAGLVSHWPAADSPPTAWGVWAAVRLLFIGLTALMHAAWAGPAVEAYKAFSAPSAPAQA